MAPRLSLAPARAATVARHGSPTRTELAGWRVGARLFGASAPPQLLQPRENAQGAEE